MITLNTYYTSDTLLNEFIEEHNLQDSSKLLIQIFTAQNDFEFITQITHFFSIHFPLSTLIGATTDGEIKDGSVSIHKSVISFSIFESVLLKSYISDSFDSYHQAGRDLASALIQDDTKAIIAFIDGLRGNGEAFLEGIHTINPNITIAGGLAGDNATFTKTYVFTKESILSEGVVGVSLSSSSLNVYSDYSFNWLPIGKTLTITHAKDNRVYTIDDKSAVETYNYYLGKEVGGQLPFVGIEFPLIIQREGNFIARAPIAKESDGSLIFAGNLHNGDKVRFGYGDADVILAETQKHINNFTDIPVESIFIYSCMARRRFIPIEIEQETLIYNQIAPTSGFFTYGEFFTHELLNQSMTILALSESEQAIKPLITCHHTHHKSTTIQALSHLISVSVNELEAAQKELKILSITDPLTHLYNRRYFTDASSTLFNLSLRDKEPLSLIMIDIDKFKTINDTFGHTVGDHVLVRLAHMLQESHRKSDFACRYGGEEFVILLPETDLKSALSVGEEFREKIESCTISLENHQTVTFTVSLGVSQIDYSKDTSIENILNRADKALYIAKNGGRNRVASL
jgi:diguanylate cyclase (GGDEF)-like protein